MRHWSSGLFDQSPSLNSQRDKVLARFDRVYEQLGAIEASGSQVFRQHREPLLTSIVAFGQEVRMMTPRPTHDLPAIKQAVQAISADMSGYEYVFSAIHSAVTRYKGLRARGADGEPKRNILVVVFTDEVGDDQQGLDDTVKLCRRLQVPVYVVGVPAPFGRQETLVKWVDPDPQYDQSVGWASVNQGPESVLPERVALPFAGTSPADLPLDSGFGPYALTRLCYESGGTYFTVHPNRTATRYVTRREIANYSAHISKFFDPEIMRRYRPDYVSAQEYRRMLEQHPLRNALVQAAQVSQAERLVNPLVRFVKRDEAQLTADLTEAQKDAAKLQPQIDAVYEILSRVEGERELEIGPRWQAGYDLAMGTVAAVKVRTEGYNAMLAQAKRGMEFADAANNTWVLRAHREISGGSRLQDLGERSRLYLQRVMTQHPDTPWAHLAERELSAPLGWHWSEQFTDLSPPENPPPPNNNTPPPRDQQRRMLERKERRPIPRL